MERKIVGQFTWLTLIAPSIIKNLLEEIHCKQSNKIYLITYTIFTIPLIFMFDLTLPFFVMVYC